MNHTSYCTTLHHSDAAKRIYETYTLHRLADPIGNIGCWFSCAIADGTSDNVLYDSKEDAIRHMHHNESYYAFVQIVPAQMTVCDAEVFLSGWRKMYDARKALNAEGLEPINRLSIEDQRAQNAGKATNLIIPGRYWN